MDVVPGRAAALRGPLPEVLVELEAHLPDLMRLRARHLGAVGDAGEHVLALEAGVVGEEVLDGHAAREPVEDERDPDAVSADAGTPALDARVYRDALEERGLGHGLLET